MLSLNNLSKRILTGALLILLGLISYKTHTLFLLQWFIAIGLIAELTYLYIKLHLPLFMLVIGSVYAVIPAFLLSPLQTILCLVFACLSDIGGYVAGKLFGRHALAPSISPNKTWEGFIGGFLCIWFFMYFYTPKLQYFAFPITCIAVVGDLLISRYKRKFHIKDTSNLLPGHGGLWDRFDSYNALSFTIACFNAFHIALMISIKPSL